MRQPAKASWIHSYLDNIVTKFMINYRTDAWNIDVNRPFPRSLLPLFQSESKCETILMKMTDSHENETACRTHFRMKGFTLRLVLKLRYKRTLAYSSVMKIP